MIDQQFDAAMKELARRKGFGPMTDEEAKKAWDEAPEVPMTKERIDEMIQSLRPYQEGREYTTHRSGRFQSAVPNVATLPMSGWRGPPPTPMTTIDSDEPERVQVIREIISILDQWRVS